MSSKAHRYEVCHVILIAGPQLCTDERLSLLAVVYCAHYRDGPLGLLRSEVLQPKRGEGSN